MNERYLLFEEYGGLPARIKSQSPSQRHDCMRQNTCSLSTCSAFQTRAVCGQVFDRVAELFEVAAMYLLVCNKLVDQFRD